MIAKPDAKKCIHPHLHSVFFEYFGQRILPLLPEDVDERLAAVAIASEDGSRITLSFVNTDLHESKPVELHLPQGNRQVEKADILTAADVHDSNSFDEPQRVCNAPFVWNADSSGLLPPHSLVRVCLKKGGFIPKSM